MEATTGGRALQEGPWLITVGSLTGLRSPWEIHKAHFWVKGFLERINGGGSLVLNVGTGALME